MKNKFVVYTALFGNYDYLIDPKEKYQGCDFICFTDQKNIKSSFWDIKVVEDIDLPLNMMNRKYKILPHLFLAKYESSMYIDTNIYIQSNPIFLAKKYLKNANIAVPRHFSRNCIYNESEIVIKAKKVKRASIVKVLNIFINSGFPKEFGLTENNIIFRTHNNIEIINLMNEWWDFLIEYIQRDQISFMYLVWKNNINLNILDINARGNKYFRIKPHKVEEIDCLFSSYYIKILEFIYNYPKFFKLQLLLTIYKKLCRTVKNLLA